MPPPPLAQPVPAAAASSVADILIFSTCSAVLLISAALAYNRGPFYACHCTAVNLAFTAIHTLNRLAIASVDSHRVRLGAGAASAAGPSPDPRPAQVASLHVFLCTVLLDLLVSQYPLWLLLPQLLLLAGFVVVWHSSLGCPLTTLLTYVPRCDAAAGGRRAECGGPAFSTPRTGRCTPVQAFLVIKPSTPIPADARLACLGGGGCLGGGLMWHIPLAQALGLGFSYTVCRLPRICPAI